VKYVNYLFGAYVRLLWKRPDARVPEVIPTEALHAP